MTNKDPPCNIVLSCHKYMVGWCLFLLTTFLSFQNHPVLFVNTINPQPTQGQIYQKPSPTHIEFLHKPTQSKTNPVITTPHVIEPELSPTKIHIEQHIQNTQIHTSLTQTPATPLCVGTCTKQKPETPTPTDIQQTPIDLPHEPPPAQPFLSPNPCDWDWRGMNIEFAEPPPNNCLH